MPSPDRVAAVGGDSFCRFFALLGARPYPASDATGATTAARAAAESGEIALLLVEEGFSSAVAGALGEEERMTLCPLPGPAGVADESGALIDSILTAAIGSRPHEPGKE